MLLLLALLLALLLLALLLLALLLLVLVLTLALLLVLVSMLTLPRCAQSSRVFRSLPRCLLETATSPTSRTASCEC